MKIQRTNWRVLATLALTFSSATALAHEYAKEAILIEHPWARPGKAATVPAAVYFEIVNRGEAGDRLLSAKTARAEHVELHLSEKTERGVVSMRPLKEGVVVAGQSTLSMETGSYHIMLIGLDTVLRDGEDFPMTLTFEKAGDIEVEIKVENRMTDAKANAQIGAASGHAHH